MSAVPRVGQKGLRFRISLESVVGLRRSPYDLAGAEAHGVFIDPDGNESEIVPATVSGNDIILEDAQGTGTTREGRWALQPVVVRGADVVPGSLVPYRVGR